MSEMQTEILIIHESVAASWATDASTYVLVLALIGTGALLGSPAMQWIGFVMVCIVGLGKAGRALNGTKKRTPQEAADHLAARYDVIGRAL